MDCKDELYIGLPAPEFSAMSYFDGDFKKINLSDYKGQYVVLFFYPLDFTFVCPTEILAFSERAEDLKKLNCQLLGCSIDSHFVHARWCQTSKKEGGIGEVKMPLIADVSKDVARKYRCLVKHGDDKGVALRATFIIDDRGVLRHMFYNDLPVGRNVDEVVRLVKAFKYSDEFGEVCPSKWKKKGDKTMKPSHKEKKTKEYWENAHK